MIESRRMSTYLIIDSNKNFARKLYDALTKNGGNYFEQNVLVVPSDGGLANLRVNIARRIAELLKLGETDIKILINAESITEEGCRQKQHLVDLAFWLRCKHFFKYAIVFYSFQSINQLLKAKPENFILLSPGCYHLRLPINERAIAKIVDLSALERLDLIRPNLKPKINLDQTRHRYANFVGMVLMMLLDEEASVSRKEVSRLQQYVLNPANSFSRELSQFLESLDYPLLKTYFNLSLGGLPKQRLSDLKLKLEPTSRMLLIDDLADYGWRPILSQMIFGDPNNSKIKSLTIHRDAKKQFDLEKTKVELNQYIDEHKPHLVLLDLRLNDEKGSKELPTLGGYQLLTYLKSNFPGLPVIMFTATNNAETTKELISVGAEAVWTKPGLDEGLSSLNILHRYESLLEVTEKTLNKFRNLRYSGSNPQFSDFRLQLLEKIEWVKYRLSLYKEDERNTLHRRTAFFDFTDIYIDTNLLMANPGVDIVENLCNLYMISKITSNTKKFYTHNSKTFDYYEPKIVISNQIFDELIKKIKTVKEPMNTLFYSIIQELFGEDIRTEYKFFNNDPNYKPQFGLRNPKEDLYADPFIIDDISHLIVLRYKKFMVESKRFETVHFPKRNVLLVSDDNDLVIKTRRMFLPQDFHRYSIKEFNNEARKIRL